METIEKITKAEALTKDLSGLKASYESLSKPGAHINICNHSDKSLPSIPLEGDFIPEIIQIVKNRIDEKWNELKEVCAEDDEGDDHDPESFIASGGKVEESDEEF